MLRFDYRGTGDSSGEFHSISLSAMCCDIQTACEELQVLSGQDRVCVIGLRLGALLAAMTSTDVEFQKLIMWDPVLDGARYIESLKEIHSQLLQSTFYYSHPRAQEETAENEILGYQYSPQLLAELESHTLRSFPPIVCPVRIVNSGKNEVVDRYVYDHQGDIKSQVVPDMGEWDVLQAIEVSFTSNNICAHICAEIS